MATTAACPSCGQRGQLVSLPDARAKCRACGGIFAVKQAAKKVCAACHADMSQGKRVKDASGRYYCYPCWEAAQQKLAAVSSLTEPPQSISQSASDLAFDAEAPQEGATADYACSVCRQLFAASDVYDNDGEFICTGCYAARTVPKADDAYTLAPATKACPFCAETILAEAKKCKHCGSMLNARPEPTVSSAPPAPTMRQKVLYGSAGNAKDSVKQVLVGLLGLVVLGVVGILVVVGLKAGLDKAVPTPGAGSSSDYKPARSVGLPTVVVEDAQGGPDSSVHFGSWHNDGVTYVLEGTMTWDGSRRIDSIIYDVTDSGVHVDGGDLIVAGGTLRANQPSRVELGCGTRPPDSKMTVTIKVQH